MGKNPDKFELKVKYDDRHNVVNNGPPGFIATDFQTPLYKEISKNEAFKIAKETAQEINLAIWTRETRAKITSTNFSWEGSLLLMRPVFAIKYPISFRYQGKQLPVYYVFLDGFAGWFEIPEYFSDLVHLICKSVRQAIEVRDFFNAFIKGCDNIEGINGIEKITDSFRIFIVDLVSNGFVKDIVNDYNLQSQAQNLNLPPFFIDGNKIAEFFKPSYILNEYY